MIEKLKTTAVSGLCLLSASSMFAEDQVPVPSDMQTIVSDASGLWVTVKALLVGITAVMIGIWVVKKIKAH